MLNYILETFFVKKIKNKNTKTLLKENREIKDFKKSIPMKNQGNALTELSIYFSNLKGLNKIERISYKNKVI